MIPTPSSTTELTPRSPSPRPETTLNSRFAHACSDSGTCDGGGGATTVCAEMRPGAVARAARRSTYMRGLDLGRNAVSSCVAAAFLAACAGPQMAGPVVPGAIGANSAASGSQTFRYTGGEQTFEVPRAVTSITVVARGGAGSGSPGGEGQGGYPSSSGNYFPPPSPRGAHAATAARASIGGVTGNRAREA